VFSFNVAEAGGERRVFPAVWIVADGKESVPRHGICSVDVDGSTAVMELLMLVCTRAVDELQPNGSTCETMCKSGST